MSSEEKDNFAFVTLATDDKYTQGALVLAYSLRSVDTKCKLVVLVTKGVSNSFRDKLYKAFDLVKDVDILESGDHEKLLLMKRPELGVTFTKLHCWKLTQFSKCVFLDADTLVIKNCDELFEKEELSAAPDVGWPDCFNSGVFVFKPSEETYKKLINFATEKGSFDGGDQGLLNMFFCDWATKDISKHLSFIYNMNTSTSYTYLPAYQKYGKNVKIVHFLGRKKPWMYNYNVTSGTVEPSDDYNHSYEHLKLWWHIYIKKVEPEMYIDANISKSFSDMKLASPEKDAPTQSSTPEKFSDESTRMLAWESGHIDYMGRDSFENIQKKLDDSINGKTG